MCYKAFVVEDNCWNSYKRIFTLLMNIKSQQNTQNLTHHCRRELNHHLWCRNKGLKLYCCSDLKFWALMRRTEYKSNLTQLWSTAYEDHVNTIQTGFKLIHWITKSRFHYFLPNCKQPCYLPQDCAGLSQSWPVYKHIWSRENFWTGGTTNKTTSYCKLAWETQ